MIYWFLFVSIFVLGLAIGSFINALEYRIGTKLSIVKGRSICPKCNKQLSWYDNVPVLSFLFLRGKCRQCKEPISWQYPVVELLTGFVFVAVTLKAGWGLDSSSWAGMTWGKLLSFFILYSIFSILILIALHDQKTTYVLSAYIYVAIFATLIYLLLSYSGAWNVREVGIFLLPNIIGSAVAMLPFAVLYLFSKGAWMGAGDIEIAVLLGFLLGWPNLFVALYFAFIVGSIWGLAKVYVLRNAGLKSEIPFAPFLIAGTIFAFVFSEQLISIYVRIFLG